MGYFLVFSALMAITSSDEILTTQSVQVKPGNPVFVIILVILAGILYMYGMIKMTGFCLNNYRDMGMDAYQGIAAMFAEKVSETVERVGDSVAGGAAGESVEGVKGSRRRRKKSEMPKEAGGGELYRDEETEETEEFESRQYKASKDEKADIGRAEDLNKEIEKGRDELKDELD